MSAGEYTAVRAQLADPDHARLRARLTELVERVDYRDDDYQFVVGTTPGMKYPYLQIIHRRPDSTTGEWKWGRGGKAYISEHATESEIFQTLFGLAKAYEEHEVREFFLVDGRRVFGPHIDTAALAEISDRLDVRSPTPVTGRSDAR